MNLSEKTRLFSALKGILKDRKLTYKDLAEKTSSSESSIKRIFSIEECSISRLTDLLAVAEITLTDLMEYASQREVDVATFDMETEEFFSENLEYFFFYRKLFHHRTLAETRKRGKYTAAQSAKFLRKLDDLGIIKWLPDDRVQFLHPEYFKFRDDGPLKATVYKAWAPMLHNAAVSKMGDGQHMMRIFSARCTTDLRDEFFREFEDLVDRFFRRASLEIKTQPTKVRPLAVSLALAPLRVGLDESDIK